MKTIKFDELKIPGPYIYVSFDNGETFSQYEKRLVQSSGIPIPNECMNFSNIVIKGRELEVSDLWYEMSKTELNNLSSSGNGQLLPAGAREKDKIVNLRFKTEDIGYINEIPENAFSSCTNLKNAIIPEGVTIIHRYAFNDCTHLISVSLPNSCTEIYRYAFEACSNLTTINIPDGTEYINSSSFEGCSSLSEIILPNTVINIGSKAFKDCSSLVSISLPENIKTISSEAFMNCTALTHIDFNIPNIMDYRIRIGESAFGSCENLVLSEQDQNIILDNWHCVEDPFIGTEYEGYFYW